MQKQTCDCHAQNRHDASDAEMLERLLFATSPAAETSIQLAWRPQTPTMNAGQLTQGWVDANTASQTFFGGFSVD